MPEKFKKLFLVPASLFFAFSQWCIIIFITKFRGYDELSSYTIAFSFVSPIFMLFNLNIRFLVLNDIASKLLFYNFRLILNLLSLLVILVSYYVLTTVFNRDISILLVFELSFFKIIDSWFELIQSFFQKKNELIKVGLLDYFRGVFIIILLILGFFLKWDIKTILFLYCVSIAIPMVIFIIKQRIIFDFEKIKNSISALLPKGSVNALIGFIDVISFNLPRFFFEDRLVGIYGNLSLIIYVSGIMFNSFLNAHFINIQKLYLNKESNRLKSFIISTCKKIVFINLLQILVVLFFGEILLRLIYKHDFSSYQPELLLFCLLNPIFHLSALISYLLYAMGDFKTMMRANIISFLVEVFILLYCYNFCCLTFSFAIISYAIIMTIRTLVMVRAVKKMIVFMV
jgi:O-antigen/teichoic acid export membrane protein